MIIIDRDRNLLASMGKRKRLVRILSMTDAGAVAQYELVDDPGNIFMPLIVNGKNVESYSWKEDKYEPEDRNDHTINSSQYGWIPLKTKIGVGG